MSAYSLSRFSGSVFGTLVVFAAVTAACGRSGLDDGDVFLEGPDGGGGPDGQGPGPDVIVPPPDSSRPCGPATCAGGCCDTNGNCQRGDSVALCGSGGGTCVNCVGLPNAGCDPNSRKCVSSGVTCNASNCKGCCSGTTCLGGGDTTACGAGGQACQNCQASGLTCQLSRGSFACERPPPPACNTTNCLGGCCDATGQCQPGFVDNECGQGGGVCIDCTLTASTCDVNITPRTCTNQQNQCPQAYPSCPAGLVTPTQPTHQNVCSQRDLQNAASACSAGAHTVACSSFFMFEEMQNPSCAKCLSPFDFDFTELKGILQCISPFVSTSCNHDIACVFDCVTQTCQKCPDPQSSQQCEAQSIMGGCASYAATLQSNNCVAGAALGTASFCFNQGGSFGTWLQSVGANYCGP